MAASRLCFICIGLEPGRDGVGDYMRELAAALPQPSASLLIGLFDADVRSVTCTREGGSDIVRIPAALSTSARYAAAAAAIDGWAPDWICLQFVTWFFGPKGVVLGQAGALKRLVGGRPLDIMFHEPWVRPPRPWRSWRRAASWLVGQAQRQSIRRLHRVLRPRLTHTSNAAYRALLAGIGIRARHLPIFGTMPAAPKLAWSDLRAIAADAGTFAPDQARERYLVVAVFGAIRERWDAVPLLDRLIQHAARDERTLLLVQVGRNTPLGNALLNDWALRCPALRLVSLGERPAAQIAGLLQQVDLGLGHQPAADMGRSTTTAAMLERGIRVVVGIGGDALRNDPFFVQWRSMLIWPDRNLERMLIAGADRPPAADPKASVAKTFLDELSAAGHDRP